MGFVTVTLQRFSSESAKNLILSTSLNAALFPSSSALQQPFCFPHGFPSLPSFSPSFLPFFLPSVLPPSLHSSSSQERSTSLLPASPPQSQSCSPSPLSFCSAKVSALFRSLRFPSRHIPLRLIQVVTSFATATRGFQVFSLSPPLILVLSGFLFCFVFNLKRTKVS